MRSYGIWRSYRGMLVGQSLSGEEVLPDRTAIKHMLSDISFPPHDVSTPEKFNSLISKLSDNETDVFSWKVQQIFQDPLSLHIASDALVKAWSLEGWQISNPFSLSPGIKHLSANVHIVPYGITPAGDCFKFLFRAGISAPGVLVPRSGLRPLCDALVQLTKHDWSELEGEEQRVISAFLAKQKIDRQTRCSQDFLGELAFLVRIIAENVGLVTKPYPCDSGEMVRFYLDGEEGIGIK